MTLAIMVEGVLGKKNSWTQRNSDKFVGWGGQVKMWQFLYWFILEDLKPFWRQKQSHYAIFPEFLGIKVAPMIQIDFKNQIYINLPL